MRDGWASFVALFPPLTGDALLLLKAVEKAPADEAGRMALIDALDECGAEFLAAAHRLELAKVRLLRDVAAAFAVPAELLK